MIAFNRLHLCITADLLDPVRTTPGLSSITPEILLLAGDADGIIQFLGEALPLVTHGLAVDFAAVVAPHSGDWQTLGSAGSRQRLPISLLAEALAVVDTTGELLLRQAVPAAAQAEPYLHQALGVARRCPCTADRHLRLVHRGI